MAAPECPENQGHRVKPGHIPFRNTYKGSFLLMKSMNINPEGGSDEKNKKPGVSYGPSI
jgi:hypothetical protein